MILDGTADRTGDSAGANLELSQLRAAAVLKVLSLGDPADRFRQVLAKGETDIGAVRPAHASLRLRTGGGDYLEVIIAMKVAMKVARRSWYCCAGRMSAKVANAAGR